MSDEASPRPWRVMRFSEEDEPDRIIDANGDEVAIELLEDDAVLIVDAVNWFSPSEREATIKTMEELRAERDRAVKYANAAPHPGCAAWKEMQAEFRHAELGRKAYEEMRWTMISVSERLREIWEGKRPGCEIRDMADSIANAITICNAIASGPSEYLYNRAKKKEHTP